MPFVKANADLENRMLKELIAKDGTAKQVHEEFTVRMELQKQFAAARKAEGLTQADVAKRAGLSQQAVSRVEKGSGWTATTLFRYLTGIGYQVNLKKLK